MMCYKDMTFCTFYDECEAGEECKHGLTETIKLDAQRAGLLISAYVDRPDCFKAR